MNFSNILKKYEPYNRVLQALLTGAKTVGISGVSESAYGQLIYQMTKNTEKASFVICYSDLEAAALFRDVSFFTDNAVYFPAKEYVYYNIEAQDRANEHDRLKALMRILKKESDLIVVASIEAVMKYTASIQEFKDNLIYFETGAVFELAQLCQKLIDMGYVREECVESVGQFSLRGGILDVFSPNNDHPVRIEFFDNEVDGIRIYDTDTQRSIENVKSAEIMQCRETILDADKREKLIKAIEDEIKRLKRKKTDTSQAVSVLESDLECISEKTAFAAIDKYIGILYDKLPVIADYIEDMSVFILDSKRIAERASNVEWEMGETVSGMLENGIVSSEKNVAYLEYKNVLSSIEKNVKVVLNVFVNSNHDFNYDFVSEFVTKTAVSFHGKIDYLIDDLSGFENKNATVVIFAQSDNNCKNLKGVLTERGFSCTVSDDGEFTDGEITIIKGSLNKGFEYPDAGIVIVSDREIFDVNIKRKKRKIENTQRIKSYNDLHPGDYVVHQAHGIGIYEGIKKITTMSVTKDYLQISYKGTDMLYIPVEQMDVLYKYSGNTDKPLKLNKLGGTDWAKTKQRVAKSTEDMAKRLVELYAKREQEKGYAYSKDTVWQREFEDTFAYTETEDQLRSIEEVKSDMEKERPMDRLLCGDVGFGKTEVALRAAFKAVMDGKQVAYLCPTTILAMQHYNTFLSRMSNFPVNIQMLSRFRTAAQQTKILKLLKNGGIDIIIGTHKLLQKDVEFKDLGLLIVDEEQRFGVAHKERLKELKKNVDVLTMTATPIPRTLHMSMISVRDMSVLTEPPENRYPVRTYVLEENPTVLLDAIRQELARGGQVFYLHNRVQGIYRTAEWIRSQIPEARVSVGHGKMKEEELEDIMYGMVNGETDVLVCTTIIETGLDIPNANTIIIENADRMGLSQLYQLRGRVGRSNRMAYAYLTYKRDKQLSDTAEKRLRAIKEFTEFGSGFKIAMRDLEIRGAGNILGAEQSGHMESVGYDMYCKILKESVALIKGENVEEEFTTSVDISVDAYIPESYISDSALRIDVYKKIADICDADEKFEIEDELIDRFGDIPKQVRNVIEVAYIKAIAHSKGIFEISQKPGFLQIKFEKDRIQLQKILDFDKKNPGRIKLIPSVKPVLNVKILSKIKILKEILELLEQI